MSRERFEEFWRSQLSYRNSDKPATLKGWDARQSEIDALNARIAELEAQLADYRENGALAVRHAPTSAHWSRELRRLFGDDARAGIDKTEAQVRTAGAEALEKVAAKLRQAGADLPVRVEGTIESAHKGGLSCALVVIEEEARRLRGEGE